MAITEEELKQGKRFVPVAGDTYRNIGGGEFVCLSSDDDIVM